MNQNNLPSWDLSDLYQNINDPKINIDLAQYQKNCLEFEAKYKGKIAKLSKQDLIHAIREYEKNRSLMLRFGNFADLNVSTQFTNKEALAFAQNVEERITDYSKVLIFFGLEINKIDEAKFEDILMDNPYKSWLIRIRKFKKFELSEELETLLHEKSITSSDAWVRLYNETSARLKYNVDGKDYSDAEISKLLMSPDEKIREKAGKEINRVSKENGALFSLIYNTIVKDKAIDDEKRGFEKPISSQNLANDVKDSDVDALAQSVRENYKNIAHHYYKIKAKWLGKDKIQYWDRNAPLPFTNNQEISWEDGVKTVLEAYKRFSPKLYEVALPFFENQWIDVPTRDGKRSGAFAASVSSEIHPYLFLNWTGKQRDVLTLAHELGHGCHMRLSAVQGELQKSTPLTISEVASVFGEMLTFQSLLEKTQDKQAKICLIASKVEDMINTAIRQIAFHFFEERVHNERKNGEVSEDRLCQIWLEEMRASLGDNVEVTDDSAYIWAQISHFYHLPFYVYAYSFADCLVNSLYQVHTENNIQNFEEKYLHMLSVAGTENYNKMLSPFGLDASKADFWNKGLSLISKYMQQLEE